MPLQGPLTASSSCLRCQLRQAILRTSKGVSLRCSNRLSPQLCREFTASAVRCQETIGKEEEEAEHHRDFLENSTGNNKRRTIYRREWPLGRVVGRPGRRQRESSETLKTDAMNRPFDVVLMRDIQEPKEQKQASNVDIGTGSRHPPTVSAAEIASELLNQEEKPNQIEVNESIDALCPNTTIIDQKHFDRLLRQLSDGYNTQQLASYLMRARKGSTIRSDRVRGSRGNLQWSLWRPGRTPIEKRHTTGGALTMSKASSRKKTITEEILRSVWKLTVHSEEQHIGEIEMSIEPWQYRYLFDIRSDKQQNYERFIHPSILLQSSEVLAYQPHSVVRILARRRDAEEVAGLLNEELKQVQTAELNLDVFKPMLGQPGWPKRLSQVLPDSDLEYVGQHTMTVLERKTDTSICIHSRSKMARQNSERLILSLLDLPSPIHVETLDVHSPSKSKNVERPVYLPNPIYSDLHYRYRSLPLSRFTTVTKKSADDVSQSQIQLENNINTTAKRITDRLASFPNAQHLTNSVHSSIGEQSSIEEQGSPDSGRSSYWEESPNLVISPWTIQFCQLLHPSPSAHNTRTPSAAKAAKSSSVGRDSSTSIVSPSAPGVTALLSYFAPREDNAFAFDKSASPARFIAHLFPSPFTASGVAAMYVLPLIELHYSFGSAQSIAHRNSYQPFRLSQMKATFLQEELHVPLPSASLDLRITRSLPLKANTDKVLEDEEISRFTQTLQRSASDDTGALAGEPRIKIKLPRSVLKKADLGGHHDELREDLEVEYFLERFEQIQTAEFVPPEHAENTESTSPVMKHVLDEMTYVSLLQYREIEGGVVGGSRSELTLIYDDRELSMGEGQRQSAVQYSTGATRRNDLRLVNASLGIASAITLINTGQLPSRSDPENLNDRVDIQS